VVAEDHPNPIFVRQARRGLGAVLQPKVEPSAVVIRVGLDGGARTEQHEAAESFHTPGEGGGFSPASAVALV